MSAKLPTPINSTAFDYQMSQVLDRYKEMPPKEALRAIVADWHEQMATILVAAIFYGPGRMRSFREQAREDGSGTVIYIPLCSSEPSVRRQP
jgi:hypothetical protein